MNTPIVDRIQRAAGIPDLLDVLAERLTPTDLQSLLLEVYRRRVGAIAPRQLLDRYESDRFVRPSALEPAVLAAFERLAWSLLPEGYAALELSPLCPLGTHSVVAAVDQNRVVTTCRNSEVVADSTNVLALECAVRRRRLLREDARHRGRIRLCASHRLVRAQAYANPRAQAHFRLLGLCVAGRDEGDWRFETASLAEQIAYHVRVLRGAGALGYEVAGVRVALTPLDQGPPERVLRDGVLDRLSADHPDVPCAFDRERTSGRGYYLGACFHVYATNSAGREFEVSDGGLTTWTQHLLANAKERLLISGLGMEVLCTQF